MTNALLLQNTIVQ